MVSRGLWVPTTEVRESGGGREAPPQLLGAQWGSLGRERWPWPAGGVGSSPVGPGRGSEVWVAMPSHPGWVGGLHQRAPTHPEDCGQPKAIRDVGQAPPRTGGKRRPRSAGWRWVAPTHPGRVGTATPTPVAVPAGQHVGHGGEECQAVVDLQKGGMLGAPGPRRARLPCPPAPALLCDRPLVAASRRRRGVGEQALRHRDVASRR